MCVSTCIITGLVVLSKLAFRSRAACRGTSLRGPSSAKTAVVMSWRRRGSDGAIEGGIFWEKVPRSSRFSNKKSVGFVMFSSYRIGNHLYSLIYFGKLPFRFVEGNSYHKLGLIWKKKGTVKLQRRGSSEKNQKGETKLAGVP